jgi:decaprenylphospho-beta-D-ribofuranose 2-oxidase
MTAPVLRRQNGQHTMTLSTTSELLTGWGLTMPGRAEVARPTTVDEVADLVRSAGPRGVLVRGAGRSYGDAAQNSGGTVIDLGYRASIEVLRDGDVVAGAGALLSDIVPAVLARGRFLPVTPGTRWITVGGAVAADVHGKNHHVDGSFGDHVRWLDLLTADGEVRRLAPDGSADDVRLLDATVGGMGLTGVVLAVRFATIPSPTSSVRVDTHRAPDLDHLMALMVDSDDSHRYSVAWLDGMARGARLGRGVLTLGDHATVDEVPAGGRDGTPSARAPRLSTPPIPVSPLNRLTLAAFNEAYFRRAPRERRGEILGLAPYFYPLDVVGRWNRMYGPRGFLQYQFAVPDSGSDVVRRTLERLAAIGTPSFLSVLKRFGPGRTQSPLSFPIAGWTLAIDVPARTEGLGAALDELDELVLAAGGRLYLAKDSRAVPATIAAGYPRLPHFRSVKHDVDPHGVFVSDLSRRLAL